MTRASRFAAAALAVATISFTTACGADEAPAPAPAPAKTQKADKAELKPWRDAIGKKKMVKIGERVFQTKGSNTCNDCHGKDGKKGRLVQAADLTQPSTWRASKALGGDQAKIDHALLFLISNSGPEFNKNYVKDNAAAGWDWSKTGATKYDIQMFGVTQSSTMGELKKIRKGLKKKGIGIPKAEIATFGAEAVYAYVKSLSETAATQGDKAGKANKAGKKGKKGGKKGKKGGKKK
jgi:mono/diheme cytochrome c family protein